MVLTPWLRSMLVGQHVWNDVLASTERDGGGSADVTARIRGTRDDSTPFSVVFGDRWLASDGMVGYFFTTAEAAATAGMMLHVWVDQNPFEDVAVTSVELDISIGTAQRWAIE